MNNTKQSKNKTKKDEEVGIGFIFEETRKRHNGMSTQLFSFVIITLLCLMLAYVLPYSLVITLPFVIVPAYFGFTGSNVAKQVKGGEQIGFFRMFRLYFSELFFGGYRVLIGFLKSFLVYTIIEFIIIIVFEYTVFPNIPGYTAILDKITTTANVGEVLGEFLVFMSTNELMMRYTFLATSFSLLVAVFFFIQHIGKHSVKIRRNLLRQPPLPSAQVNYVYKRVRKDHRGEFLKTYLRCAWLFQLVLIVAGVGGILISFFLLKDFNPAQAIVISLALMLIVSIPLLNYVSVMQDMIYLYFAEEIEKTNITVTLELIDRFKDKIDISEEDAQKIHEVLEQSKKSSEDILNKDKGEDEEEK